MGTAAVRSFAHWMYENAVTHTLHRVTPQPRFNDNGDPLLSTTLIPPPPELRQCALLSCAAYESPDIVPRWTALDDATESFFFVNGSAMSPLLTDTQAYVWCGPTIICVAFRGTDGKRDAMADADQQLVEFDDVDGASMPASNSVDAIAVHRGVYRHFRAIRAELTALLVRCDGGRRKRLLFTGHSLGGAVAAVAAVCIGYRPTFAWSSVTCHTFGAPRVGTAGFVCAFRAVVNRRGAPPSYRVFHRGDPVVMLPTGRRYVHTDGGRELPGFVPCEDVADGTRLLSLARLMVSIGAALKGERIAEDHACARYAAAMGDDAYTE